MARSFDEFMPVVWFFVGIGLVNILIYAFEKKEDDANKKNEAFRYFHIAVLAIGILAMCYFAFTKFKVYRYLYSVAGPQAVMFNGSLLGLYCTFAFAYMCSTIVYLADLEKYKDTTMEEFVKVGGIVTMCGMLIVFWTHLSNEVIMEEAVLKLPYEFQKDVKYRWENDGDVPDEYNEKMVATHKRIDKYLVQRLEDQRDLAKRQRLDGERRSLARRQMKAGGKVAPLNWMDDDMLGR